MKISPEILEGIIRKVISESKKIKLIQFRDEYFESIRYTCSESYLRTVKSSFNQLLNYTDNIPLQNLDVKSAEGFFNKNYKRSKYAAALYHRTLKAAFNKALNWDYISVNPFAKIKIPRLQNEKPKFICFKELETILHFAPDNLKDLYEFAFLTGLRLSEIINLKWSNVDLTEKVIQVGDNRFTTKSKKIRIVPLCGKAYKLLSGRSIHNNKAFVFGKSGSTFPFTTNYVSKKFKQAVRLAGADDKIHFHSLRHSFASDLVNKGVPLYHIKELLGHSSIAVTEIYSHPDLKFLHDAVNKL